MFQLYELKNSLFKIQRDSTNTMILFLSFSNIVGNIISIISGILVARWLLPKELGFFNSFTIITSYIILIQAGIPSGLSRELPFYLGANKRKIAENYASVTQFWLILLSVISIILSILIAVYFILKTQYQYAAGTFVIGVTSWQGLYVTKYLKLLYRTNRDFKKLSQIRLIVAFVSFLSIVFVWQYGFYGLCLRALIITLVDFYFSWRWRPIQVTPKWNNLFFKKLLQVGMPMYIVSNVYSLWPVIQKTLIVTLGGTKALGLFAIAVIVENAMKTISSAISNVIYPTMATEWGKGASVKQLIMTHTLKPILLTGIILLFTISIGWYLLPYTIGIILPKYREGITAAQWMLLVGFLGLFNVFSNVYNVIMKQKERLFSYISGIVAWAVSILVFYWFRGFSLQMFPQAMIMGIIIMTIINFYYIKQYWNMVSPLYMKKLDFISGNL